MLLLLLALQAATSLPTIELTARVEAREVVVERRGQASLTVRAEPDAGSRVEVVERPEGRGQRVIRNYRADLDARAVVADPQQVAPSSPVEAPGDETSQPDEG